MWAERALAAVLALDGIRTVLDIGAGPGEHAVAFRAAGRIVTTTDHQLRLAPDILGDFPDGVLDALAARGPFDLVWSSHVLEHARDPGRFLDAAVSLVAPGGALAVTVPPMKPQLVGGHLSLWTLGLLVYHLVLAGVDCSAAACLEDGYNLSVVVPEVRRIGGLPALRHDAGDLERLAPWFPVPVFQGMVWQWSSVHWPPVRRPVVSPTS